MGIRLFKKQRSTENSISAGCSANSVESWTIQSSIYYEVYRKSKEELF